MPHYFIALSQSLGMLCLTALALSGWGRVCQRLAGIPREEMLATGIWFGFVLVICIAEALQLFFPINWMVSVTIGVPGIVMALPGCSRYLLRRHASLVRLQPTAWLAVCVVMFVVILCTYGMHAPEHYDSGLYHLQTIRWMNEYSILPGLGNVQGRLAFNQSYFTFVSLLNFFPFWNKGYGIANVMLLLLSVGTLMELQLHRLRYGVVFLAGLIAALVYKLPQISSPSPDFPIAALHLVIFALMVRVFMAKASEVHICNRYSALVVLLCITAVTIKLSAAMYALTTLLVLLLIQSKEIWNDKRILFGTLLLGSLFWSLHLVRGYIYSGVPLYPSAVAGAWTLDWAMARSTVNGEAAWIYSWARGGLSPDQVGTGWDWLKPWAKSFPKYGWLLLGFSAIAVPILFCDLALRWRRKSAMERRMYLLLFPQISAIVFWFITAPDLRFLGLIPWILAIFTIWLFLKSHSSSRIFQYLEIKTSPRISLSLAMAILILAWSRGGRLEFNGWEELPAVRTKVMVTDSGLRMSVPIDSDQCWDTPLPCTPYFSTSLRSRSTNDPNNLEAGFSIKTP